MVWILIPRAVPWAGSQQALSLHTLATCKLMATLCRSRGIKFIRLRLTRDFYVPLQQIFSTHDYCTYSKHQ